MEMQKTIQTNITLHGKGLHSGNAVSVTLCPAQENAGICFIRKDLPGSAPLVLGSPDIIDFEKSKRMSCLSKAGVEVHTVEHLLASLAGLGIDNVRIEVDGPELPAMDGSSQPFVEAIQKAGIQVQNQPRSYFTVTEPMCVEDNGAMVVVTPCEELTISYLLQLNVPAPSYQLYSLVVKEGVFHKELAPARTFCLEAEAEALIARGFGKGATYENTVVLTAQGTAKQTSLRFSDEPVRHKLTDLLGDLAVVGKPLKANIMGVKSGHFLNLKLVQQITELIKKSKIEKQKNPVLCKAVDMFEGKTAGVVLDNATIQTILPHRYPFLLIDRVAIIDEDKRIVGIKNVTCNEPFFVGHFPGRPIMPGVLILEALAQVGGVLLLYKPENRGKYAYFMGMDEVKFRKPVLPGDQLLMDIEVVKARTRMGIVQANAYVNGSLVCEAALKFSLVD